MNNVIEVLTEKGFSSQQISQIIKIEELGVNIKNKLSTDVDVSLLRQIKTAISKDTIKPTKRKLVAEYILKKNYDITKFLEAGVEYDNCISTLYQMEMDGFNINDYIDPNLSTPMLRLIHKFLKSDNYNVKKLVLKNYDESMIKLYLEFKSIGKNMDDFVELGFKTQAKLNAIYEAYSVNFDILKYTTEKFNDKQLKTLVDLYKENPNANFIKISKLGYSANIMKLIAKGLEERIDITPYLKDQCSQKMAETVLNCLRNGLDPSSLIDIKNETELKISYILLKNNIAIKPDFSKYNAEQLKAFNKILSSYDISKLNLEELFDAEYSEYQIVAIANYMSSNRNYDVLKIKGLSNRQIKLLMEAPKEINLTGLVDLNTTPVLIEALINLLKAGYKIEKSA